jgi:hypothetical protein
MFLCDKENYTYKIYGCIGYGANIGGNNPSLIIQPNQKECFSGYTAKSWGYLIQTLNINENLPSHDQNRKKIAQLKLGDIQIEKCDSKTMEIN